LIEQFQGIAGPSYGVAPSGDEIAPEKYRGEGLPATKSLAACLPSLQPLVASQNIGRSLRQLKQRQNGTAWIADLISRIVSPSMSHDYHRA